MTAASSMIDAVRARPWGIVAATVIGDDVEHALVAGDDPISEGTLFQIGSVTKPMTGLLLADSTLRKELTLDTTVKELLGADSGNCGQVTLLQLATQASGLPRLPPNLVNERFDQSDPYAHYLRGDLIEALAMVASPTPGAFEYSNFGFSLLGCLLEAATGSTYADLLRTRVFEPIGMTEAFCGLPAAGQDAVQGYGPAGPAPWWDLPLPAAGGVACHIRDVARFVWANANPAATPLAEAFRLSHQVHGTGPLPETSMGLAWFHQSTALWHNGGTGGFHSFVAFHPDTATGVAMIANCNDVGTLNASGLATLTELAARA
jgi:CubicO group peptidase (beta-lactamase class C family)